MDAIPRSPFDTLEICFRLLTTGPACLALNGRRLGHGLPARRIPLGALRVLLQHPAATSDLQCAALEELIHLASQQHDRWMVGVVGVLLPALRRITASIPSIDQRVASHVEADLLEVVRDVIGQQAPGAAQLALDILRFTCGGQPMSPRPIGCSDPVGAERSRGSARDVVPARHRQHYADGGNRAAAR
jgi:hypothetical protein